MGDWRQAIDVYIESHTERWRAVRRQLHAHPEPSREEYRTTRFLSEQLEEEGVPVRTVPSGRGLIAGREGRDDRPLVAMRADIDALRMNDAKAVPYRSSCEGVMHACGHDAHAAMLLAASLALWTQRDVLPEFTAWRAIFQPAEEVGEGALEMIAAGAVENVRAIVALHVDPDLAVGRVGYRTGVLTAACQDLHVKITGMGGHAARPHLSVDPIGVAVQFINSIYQFVPRSVDSRDPVVVTFGCIQGGTSANVIPEEVALMGTIRTVGSRASTQVKEKIMHIARGLSGASGAAIDVQFGHGTGAVDNDPRITAVCVQAAREVAGLANVEEIPLPSMGGEDFSSYLTQAPGCMMRLGVASPDSPRNFLHTPLFDIDERALAIGAKLLARSMVLLSDPSRPGATSIEPVQVRLQ
jgi:amidohydrolase